MYDDIKEIFEKPRKIVNDKSSFTIDIHIDNENLLLLSNDEQEAYFNYISKVRNKSIQDQFRKNLLNEFQGKCALCDIDESQLLIASHIIPYSMCAGDVNIAGDSNNGLLLCPIHDALFESGNYISFDAYGKIIISSKIKNSKLNDLHINENLYLDKRYLTLKRIEFLESHRLMFDRKNK